MITVSGNDLQFFKLQLFTEDLSFVRWKGEAKDRYSVGSLGKINFESRSIHCAVIQECGILFCWGVKWKDLTLWRKQSFCYTMWSEKNQQFYISEWQ